MLYLNTELHNCNAAQLHELLPQLPLWRRQQAMRYRHLQGQRECVLSYLELCRGLREEYGILSSPDFEYDLHGKPSLAGFPHIFFSISHCARAVGCLLADVPCGLDIECVRPLRPSLVRHTMNEEEQQAIFSDSRPDLAFIRLWTQKEAVLKLKGTGIAGGLKESLSPASLSHISLHTVVDSRSGIVVTTATRSRKQSL